MSKLTALEVEKQQSPGRYADGNGLYLEVTKAGTKTWLFRYQLNGKRTQLGLGSYNKKTNSLLKHVARLWTRNRWWLRGFTPRRTKNGLIKNYTSNGLR